MARIVVTGCAGFVGSHVSEALLAAGHEVVGIDGFTDYYARRIKEANLAPSLAHPAFRFYERAMHRDPLDECVEGADVVVNLAAMPGLPGSWTNFRMNVDCNLVSIQRLLEACRGASLRRFVHISTSSVYGRHAVGDESQPLEPVSPYGVTKLAAEHLLWAYAAAQDLPATVLRYFSVYGPRQRPDMAYHIFIETMREGGELTLYGDGLQTRSTTFVSDAVRGTIQAIDGAAVGEVYNIGGGEPITLNDALASIAAAMEVTPAVVHGPARHGDQRHTRADTSKAREAFGYAPTVTPAEGIPRQVAWQLGRA